MSFQAQYPNCSVKFKTLENSYTSLIIEGVIDGFDGIHRDIFHQAVYDNNGKMKFMEYNDNQRLNWNSGWINRNFHIGDTSLAIRKISTEKNLEYDNDLNQVAFITLDNDNEKKMIKVSKTKNM